MPRLSGLEISNLRVTFGGLVAVDDVSLSAPLGRVTGLIGPNGAGKSTTFNACSGLSVPAAGHIHLFDQDVTGLSTSRRAELGLGRTFQRVEVCDSLTALDNVALGYEARHAGSNPIHHVWARRGEWAEAEALAEDALKRCGIGRLARRRVGELSTGQRRLVELARVVAGRFQMLLLDEPSSGLDRSETEHFGEVLSDLANQEGRGVLLVEHDMALVMAICPYLYVLDFGRLIFEGSAAEVAASSVVRDAYLGSEAA